MKRTQKKKKCKGCGIKFIAHSGNQIYCSEECRDKESKKRCAQRYKKRKAEKKARRAEEKKRQKEVHMSELAVFNEKAKQHGFSYGQYMIFLQMERDREERVRING